MKLPTQISPLQFKPISHFVPSLPLVHMHSEVTVVEFVCLFETMYTAGALLPLCLVPTNNSLVVSLFVLQTTQFT